MEWCGSGGFVRSLLQTRPQITLPSNTTIVTYPLRLEGFRSVRMTKAFTMDGQQYLVEALHCTSAVQCPIPGY